VGILFDEYQNRRKKTDKGTEKEKKKKRGKQCF